MRWVGVRMMRREAKRKKDKEKLREDKSYEKGKKIKGGGERQWGKLTKESSKVSKWR